MCWGRSFVSDSILKLRNLNVYFREESGQTFQAVRGLDVDLDRGTFSSLVGQTGSGKTVTALAICRLLKASKIEGEILYNDGHKNRDLLKIPQKELLAVRGRRIAYIFQDPASSLNPVMKMGEQIEEACLAHHKLGISEVRKKSFQLLHAARISDVERVYDSFPHELSGGMKQRAMIAAAILMEPEILIADEPTAALDPSTATEVMELLSVIRKERNLTVLFITHHLGLASRYSDAITVMKQGSVVERMTRSAAGFVPQEAYTRKLFNADLVGLKPKSFIEV